MPSVEHDDVTVADTVGALVDAGHVAARFAVPKARVYEEVRAGRIPGVVRLGERTLRFDLRRLDQFIASGGTLGIRSQKEAVCAAG